MPHNLFEGKVGLNRKPAWHGLGTVFTQDVDAYAAAQTLDVGRQYGMMPYVHGKRDQLMLTDYQAIVSTFKGTLHTRGAYHIDGKSIFIYGVVSKDYELLEHRQMCALWDLATHGAPVETIGVLGKGETLFLTSKLPGFDVAGDACSNYLLLMSPLDGKTAITAKTTSVRVVCQNTLNLALGEHAEQAFRGVHTRGVGDRVRDWLAGVWERQAENLAVLQEAYAVLACAHPASIDPVVETVYPFPAAPEDANTATIHAWLTLCATQEGHRNSVVQLYQDSPTRSHATDGTLWGAYNAVCEYEDFYRPRLTARSRCMGEGAVRKSRAFTACMSLV